jgi:hypothetical protein
MPACHRRSFDQMRIDAGAGRGGRTPTRGEPRRILSPLRLPVPPSRPSAQPKEKFSLIYNLGLCNRDRFRLNCHRIAGRLSFFFASLELLHRRSNVILIDEHSALTLIASAIRRFPRYIFSYSGSAEIWRCGPPKITIAARMLELRQQAAFYTCFVVGGVTSVTR